MRIRAFSVGGAILAAALLTVAPAAANCPGADGTAPGTPPSVTTIGTGDATPFTTIYVDDRDWLDLDEDGDAGGIWIYVESNGFEGLQRGGEHLAADYVPPMPGIDPVPICLPNPAGLPPSPPSPAAPCITLFPCANGVASRCTSGGGLLDFVLYPDDCRTDESGAAWSGPRDRILF